MMARTPLQVLEDDVREEARRSTAKKLVALYWAIPVACFGAALYCLYQIPGGAMFFASLAAILAAAVGASLGFGLTWTFWVVAKDAVISDRDSTITELKKRPTQEDVGNLKKEHAEAIAELKSKIAELEKRPTRKAVDELKSAHAEEIAAKDAEIAEVRHSRDRQLEKYRNVFDLDRFDVRSCRVMFEVYEAESGPRGALYLSSDNLVAASLISEGVLDMYGSTLRDGRHAFRLTPEWRRFIRGNLNELRERLAEDQRDAGEDGDDRASARGKIAEAEREDPR